MSGRLDWNQITARLSAIEELFENALRPGREEIQRVYRERAVRLGKPFDDRDREKTEPVMVFRVGLERYAIELAHLAGVVRLRNFTPIPGTPQHIAGLINVRGDTRLLLNLKALLRLESATPAKAEYALLLNAANRGIGLQVDSVEGVGQFSKKDAVSVEECPYVTFRSAESGMLLSAGALVEAMGGK